MLTEEENLQILDNRISKLKLKHKIVIAFDFDELVIERHLAREVGAKVSYEPDPKLIKELGGYDSLRGIEYMVNLRKGIQYKDYCRIRDEILAKTPWREGFKELLLDLMPIYSIIFVSSGIKDVVYEKVKEINFNEDNIIAGENKISGDVLDGPALIIPDRLKGYIISKLREKYKVIAIGHSRGDKPMLDEADVSISFRSDIPNLAQHNVNSVDEIRKIMEETQSSS